MKILIFVDFDNFCKSIEETDALRKERVSGFAKFVTDYLREKEILSVSLQDVIRTYAYTGEFTDTLIKRIIRKSEGQNDKKLGALAASTSRRQEWQRNFFDRTISFDSFELRTKPLQFQNGKIFQKGIDVQIAVDMVSHAFNNSYDVAILCSGDVDLIESIKLVKNLGKKVIVCSSWKTSAKAVRKEADIFVDFTKLEKDELDKFSIVLSNP